MSRPGRKKTARVALAACLGITAALASAQEAYRLDPAYRLTLPVEPVVPQEPLPLIATPILAPDRPFAREIDAAARAADLDPALVHAVIAVESAYRPAAVSPKGAVGLMQLMPGTASRYGVTRLTQVEDNLRAGTRHLRELKHAFGPRLDLVLAAYNAGEGAVRRFGNEVPPYRETRAYVPAVMERFQSLAHTGPPAPPRRQNSVRDYLAGTRLEPLSLLQLD
ncbi:MAG: lytic transglycosylase domain-containing protein [Burkholderiales bacterium]|nr:lytic transglycosylase domain-containing protein [Burkholderiales bacterium]